MTRENQVPELTPSELSEMDIEALTGLLVLKTEHLLVASRCKLPEHVVGPMRREVKQLQAEIMGRTKPKQSIID